MFDETITHDLSFQNVENVVRKKTNRNGCKYVKIDVDNAAVDRKKKTI